MEVFLGILIPFAGTTLGAACVLFMKNTLGVSIHRALAGFAAGVMVAASIWSLLIPSIEQSEHLGIFSFLPAFVGFWIGVLFLLALDDLIPHLHVGSNEAEGLKSKLNRTTMMVLAVTLHNIPEGMAVGVMYAGFLAGNTQITAASALALSIGIAIQNFPESSVSLFSSSRAKIRWAPARAMTTLLACWLIWEKGRVKFLLRVRKDTSVPSVTPPQPPLTASAAPSTAQRA